MKRDEFFSAIQIEFSLEFPITDETELSADFGLDSLDMIDLVTFIEEVAGVQPNSEPTMDYPRLATGADAYAYFESLQQVPGLQSPHLVGSNGVVLRGIDTGRVEIP